MTDIQSIKAFAADIDGIFTNGQVLALPDGDLLRQFDSKDVFAVRTATDNGYPFGIITGGYSKSLYYRCTSMGIPDEDIHQMSKNKLPVFLQFCESHGLKPSEVVYFGDDIPDLETVKAAGIGVVPHDAVEQLRKAADFVSPYNGGHLCLRHFIEMILTTQERWIFRPDKPWKGFPPDPIKGSI
ncbi:MAG: HAD hydrolase family protein [Bacteroidales bacterium]|jgi:3-deoxy-D-manno-octulosonate 8-phosphate phosphatase (KDO 8-P phosphatase)|nr:HAD hydrolase family protein [Bacteroidales bacterium]MCI2122346.1 HAD hydrolase family protein [Bacteroidales bacterium]MCI2146184.1 HAD hydrolase family protein [Bacteroidales bacterium]